MSAESEELYSLLVPLSEDRLIVPRACVAEVVRYAHAEKQEGANSWMQGTINWNGRPLPVVSFEGALGKEVPVATGRTRVVVFYSITGELKGFPQLVRVNRDVLKLEAKDGWPETAPVLCRVKMINEFPMIPNLELLEKMLANEMLQA